MGDLHNNNLCKPIVFFLASLPYENSVSLKLLWAKLALVVDFISLFRDSVYSENNEDKGSLLAASVACVQSTVPLLRTNRAIISKRVR